MSFIWPTLLWLLLAAPLGVGLYVQLQRRRQQAVARYGSFGLGSRAAGRGLGWRRHVPPALFLAGLAVLIVSLARPQMVVGLPRQQGTVILAFDVSGSMAADDFTPTRLEAAKAAAREFVDQQPPGVQIGVVAFSDNGFAVQAPSEDQPAILAAINRLTPQHGTSLAQGILASLNALAAGQEKRQFLYSNLTPEPTAEPIVVAPGANSSTVIVLLTDGENNEYPDPLAAAQAAADQGVRIVTVGIGSAAGTTLRINGFAVHTQLDEAALQAIAQLTEGAYYNAANPDDLGTIYDNLDLQFVIKPEEMEITSILAGLAILLFLAGGVLSLWWFSRLP